MSRILQKGEYFGTEKKIRLVLNTDGDKYSKYKILRDCFSLNKTVTSRC